MQDRFRKGTATLDEETIAAITAIKDKAQELAQLIDNSGPCREGSVAITNIETAVMWATKAVTRKFYP